MTLDTAEALARPVLDGRAAVFVRFGVASAAYVGLAALWRRTLSADGATWAHVATSLAMLVLLTTPLVTAALVVHAAALLVAVLCLPPGVSRSLLVVALLAAHVAMPVFWFPTLPGYTPHVREFVTFATNAGLLRAWAWVRDRPRLHERGGALVRDYALYTFFLPAFVNGPFFSPLELGRRRIPAYWGSGGTSDVDAGPGIPYALRRILIGVIAAAVATALADVLTASAYRQAATGSTWAAWRHAVAVYLWFYVAFTAWTEASIGFATLAGIRLPENFDRPLAAYGLADFWRRWNVTLGRWMLQYVYLPLAPRGRASRAFPWYGTGAVFSSVAIYHYLGGLKLVGPTIAWFPGFWIPWFLWAVLNTVAVRVTHGLGPPARVTPGSVAVVGATLAVASLGMMIVFFPVELPLELLRRMLARMVMLAG